jgi:EAL domain-containing protein (putative c-di-GMP-specific phosphodiesterase class I)
LFLGSKRDHTLLIKATREREQSLHLELAENRNEFEKKLVNGIAWDLILSKTVPFIEGDIGDVLKQYQETMDASCILLKNAKESTKPSDVYELGVKDIVLQSDTNHLAMVISREMETVLLKRALKEMKEKHNRVVQLQTVPGSSQPPEEPAPQLDDQRFDSDVLAAIKQAISKREVILVFQPIIRLDESTDTPKMFEVLARIKGPTGEYIYPKSFIPVAEQHNLMHFIDRIVIRESLKLLAKLQKERETDFFINISGNTIRDCSFAETIIEDIRDSAITPGTVTFEICKTTAINNPAETTHFSKLVSDLNLNLLLESYDNAACFRDDMQDLKINYVKLGPTVFRGLADLPEVQDNLRKLVDCARQKKIEVIAHTIESPELLPLMYSYGIDYIQGYFVSGPVEALVYPEINTVEVDENINVWSAH